MDQTDALEENGSAAVLDQLNWGWRDPTGCRRERKELPVGESDEIGGK